MALLKDKAGLSEYYPYIYIISSVLCALLQKKSVTENIVFSSVNKFLSYCSCYQVSIGVHVGVLLN